jgi:hypothetical protein
MAPFTTGVENVGKERGAGYCTMKMIMMLMPIKFFIQIKTTLG